VIAFDADAQAELLRLEAGDPISVQGLAKIALFEKGGVTRASLDVQAAYVLPLRKPKKAVAPKLPKTGNKVSKQQITAPPLQPSQIDFDDGFPSNL
jgi:hypothetical protein